MRVKKRDIKVKESRVGNEELRNEHSLTSRAWDSKAYYRHLKPIKPNIWLKNALFRLLVSIFMACKANNICSSKTGATDRPLLIKSDTSQQLGGKETRHAWCRPIKRPIIADDSIKRKLISGRSLFTYSRHIWCFAH